MGHAFKQGGSSQARQTTTVKPRSIPPHRMDTDAGSGQAGRALAAIAGKHATLASYTFFGIFNGKSHNTFSSNRIANVHAYV